MDLRKRLILGSFCALILAPISFSEHFALTSSPSVTGNVGQEVVLPCQISLRRQPQSMEVQWRKIGDHPVSIYQYKASSGLETFAQGYTSRTVMDKDRLSSGNVSLKLKNVQVSDEGTYRCIVQSTGWSDNTQTVLHVTGMGMVSIEILGPEGEGIKLACRSSGWFPRPELQWVTEDNHNHPFDLEQDPEQLFNVFSTVTVLRGTRQVTCLVHEKSHLQMKQESTIFLSRDIFPRTSPWLPAFWLLFMLSFLGFGVTGYYIYKEKKKSHLKKCTEEQEKLIHENRISTLEQDKFELQRRLETAQMELDFTKAQSNFVQVHLDPRCKHPKLEVSADCTEVQHSLTSSAAATTMPGALIVVGKEGFAKGQQYWQVCVGDNPDWELGVLTETTREKLQNQKFDAPLEEGYWSLRKSNGKYQPEEADHEISSYCVKPQVIGVYLDCEEHIVSFYAVNSKKATWKTATETSEKLYPFFSPGHSEVKPLSICHNRDWDFPSQSGQQNSLLSSSNDEKANTSITDNSQESRITENSPKKGKQKFKRKKFWNPKEKKLPQTWKLN